MKHMIFFSKLKLARISAKTFWISGFLFVSFAIIGTGVALGRGRIASNPKAPVLGEAKQISGAIPLAIETVGANDVADGKSLGTSWPGEIVSLGDLEIHPVREGTIVEWFVGVGQKIRRGQAVARLSAPPAGPDITKMLAEQAKMVSETKSDAAAMANYAEKNKKQLLTLRTSLDKNITDVGNILNSDATSNRSKVTELAKGAIDQARDMAIIKQKKVRAIIERALTSEFPEIVSSPKDPVLAFRATGYFTTVFDSTIGILDSEARQEFASAAIKLLNELKDPAAIPEEASTAYFQAAIRVVLASISSVNIPESKLSGLRKMISDDKSEFLMAVADVWKAKTEIAMKETDAKMKETEYAMSQVATNKDFAMQKKEIDEKIAMLEKDVELAQGKVRAAEVSYGTIVRSLTEGLNIIAPRDGIVSVIMKKNGDFVGPSTAVASLNSGDSSERFVRFRIPSNLQAPKLGSMLTINRPGFPTDIKTIKLVGIGTALNENGSYVADANFVDKIDWPVRASVRVMPPTDGSPANFIPLSAVWWDENGKANVWIIENNILHVRQVITGRTLADSIEVIEGLKPGETYVSKPMPGLKEGMSAMSASSGLSPSGDHASGDLHGGHDE